ncbi:MAG: Lipl32 family lipoprotein [Treponematales bacterium]
MKNKSIFGMLCVGLAFAFTVTSCATAGLPVFGAELGKRAVGPKVVRLPYTSVTSYFGYIKPGAEPDAVVEGRKTYFIYVWVPLVAPELGIRMISPVPKGAEPKEGDFVTAAYEAEGKTDTTHFFDTWIQLERADSVLSVEDFSKVDSTNWTRYASNDDSSEMPKNPRGLRYNSLMRVESEVSNPLKALVRGLYRVSFTTFKRGEVEGSFLAQVAAPIALPGIVMGATVDEVKAKIEAAGN